MLEVAFPGEPAAPETVLMHGSGRLRRRPLPRLPIRVRIAVRPGSDRVMDISVGAGPVALLRGLDAFIDGRGLTKVARSIDVGPEVDQGSFPTIVLETLLFPGAWPRLGLVWEAVDATTTRLHAPFEGGYEIAIVTFDRVTGFPASYEVPRHRGPGPKVDWRVEFPDWRRFGSVWEPGRIAVRWMDEPSPWLTLRIKRVELDTDIDNAIARARTALAEA